MENTKKIIITVLSVLVCIMALGYALLAQELTIKGRASIDSRWKVEITDINSKDIIGDAVNKVDPSYTATTASFSVGFTQPGDSITYDITVTNKGTLDAVVENITVNKGNNSAIKYTTSGLKRGDKILKNNGTNILTIKVEYDANATVQQTNTTNDITVTINYQQDLGQITVYNEYSVGDVVNFSDSNWRVIKNSTGNEDYVTLMKETVLTNAELGNYAYGTGYDTMSYYWDNNCHPVAYGYSSSSYSCNNTNGYATSKVKEFLEGTYINTLGADNLKEVDGYKIRLITTNELNENLGWVNLQVTAKTDNENANVPTWVYKNYGENQNNVWGYWTMTPHPDNSSVVWLVSSSGRVDNDGVSSGSDVLNSLDGVRPVINLLKSTIE